MNNLTWEKVLSDYVNSKEYKVLMQKVNNEYQNKTIYPAKENLFKAFKLTPLENVKVVIVGQVPYHGEGEAHGLSFSVPEGISLPPSLRNIYQELYNDLGIKHTSGDLSNWAKEGVLLLNSTLTVIKDTPNSHKDIGWAPFTDYVIKAISDNLENVVFILWGNFAISKSNLIDPNKHLIIKSVHPSPLSASRGFFGSKPFSKANLYLKEHHKKEINW